MVCVEMSRLFRLTLGIVLILIGVAGGLLPIVQGWLFVALGVLLLAPDVPFLQRLACRVERRFPRVRQMSQRFRVWLFRDRQPPPPCPPEPE
jgi:uncharacterized protein